MLSNLEPQQLEASPSNPTQSVAPWSLQGTNHLPCTDQPSGDHSVKDIHWTVLFDCEISGIRIMVDMVISQSVFGTAVPNQMQFGFEHANGWLRSAIHDDIPSPTHAHIDIISQVNLGDPWWYVELLNIPASHTPTIIKSQQQNLRGTSTSYNHYLWPWEMCMFNYHKYLMAWHCYLRRPLWLGIARTWSDDGGEHPSLGCAEHSEGRDVEHDLGTTRRKWASAATHKEQQGSHIFDGKSHVNHQLYG